MYARVLEEAGVDVTVLEVPWGQHGFDALSGLRARSVAGTIADWLGSRVGPRPDRSDRLR